MYGGNWVRPQSVEAGRLYERERPVATAQQLIISANPKPVVYILSCTMKTLFALAGLWVSIASSFADGGVVLARQVVNGFDLTVFASPSPLRAGPVDVSVLVQNPENGGAVLDADVAVAWSSKSSASPDWLPPCCTMDDGRAAIPATRGHSQNQFLYSAIVPIRSAGPSELVLHVNVGGKKALLSCDVKVLPPQAPAQAYWPLLALPPFVVAGFTLHQRLSRRRGVPFPAA